MSTLRVIVDEVVAPGRGTLARYAEELTRALIGSAPRGTVVSGFTASSTETDYERLTAALPGLSDLSKSALTRRQLTRAWQHGFTPMPAGMLHAPSLFAPLRKHDRVQTRGDQVVVTLHDADAWVRPERIGSRAASWTKAMAQRAVKYADAVVVPTHALAAELDGLLDLGDRIRIIAAAPGSRVTLPVDAEARAIELDLPEHYLLAVGDTDAALATAALSLPGAPDLTVLVAGGSGPTTPAVPEDDPAGRVRHLATLTDAAWAVVVDRASALIVGHWASGFALPMLEAFALGTPVIHSSDASVTEVAGDAGIPVGADTPEGWLDAITSVLGDSPAGATARVLGQDRAGLFTWASSAEQVWQLHADL